MESEFTILKEWTLSIGKESGTKLEIKEGVKGLFIDIHYVNRVETAPKMRAKDSNVGEIEAAALNFQPLQLTSHLLQAVHDVLHLVVKYLPPRHLKNFFHHNVLQCEEG